MENEPVWHVARAKRGGWKVFPEGGVLPESRHDERKAAVEAALSLARRREGGRVKVHDEDNQLQEELVVDLQPA